MITLKEYNASFYKDFIQFVLDPENEFFESGKLIVNVGKFLPGPDVIFYFKKEVVVKNKYKLKLLFKVCYDDDLASINTLENEIKIKLIHYKVYLDKKSIVDKNNFDVLSDDLRDIFIRKIDDEKNLVKKVFQDFFEYARQLK